MTESLRQLSGIIDGNLCHRCGTCSAICPREVLEPNDDGYPSWSGRENRCINCEMCVQVCPGRQFSYADHVPLLFGCEPDYRKRSGFFIKAWTGHVNDAGLLSRATSGGLATEIPRFLLKEGRITGAVAVKADPKVPWRPVAFVGRSPDEMLVGANSKYPACSLNHTLRQLAREPGPWIVTGLPCHIHGIRKLCRLRKEFESKICLTVGLFCHSCLDHQAIRDMLKVYSISDREIAEVIYRNGKLPGEVHARLRDGRWIGLPYPFVPIGRYRPNAKEFLTFLFKLYSPLRCRMCIDAASEFADISLSDPWIAGWQAVSSLKHGRSFVLARTDQGRALLEEMASKGVIALDPFPLDQAQNANGHMTREKRLRAFYNIRARRLRNQPTPIYGMDYNLSPAELRAARLHAAPYFAADRPRIRHCIIRALLSRAGRWIVGVVLFRRRVLIAALEKWRARQDGHK